MEIHPVVLGRGASGQAMLRSLAVVGMTNPELGIRPAIQAPRGARLAELRRSLENPVLLVANPHALHTPAILEGVAAGYKAIVTEKPPCISPEQLAELEALQFPVSVCHVYRAMWGPRTIRKMIAANELGEIIAVDARCWLSSSAQRARDSSAPFQLWKNDPALTGPFDVLIDNVSHWVDMAIYLMGEPPQHGSVWLSYINAEAPHRDTHAHVTLVFRGGRPVRASISKTVHGTGNDFEFTVIGSHRAATWAFPRPDVIEVGEGGERRLIPRQDSAIGSGVRAFHALGWTEGYVEIIRQTLLGLIGRSTAAVPTLAEGLQVMRTIFSLEKAAG